MSTLAVLLLVVGPAGELPTAAMTTASRDVLAGRARVTVERAAVAPSDDEVVARASAVGASAVVEVSWPDVDGTRAHLHAHLRPSAAWIDRDLRFETASPGAERGRAVGLTIAAMIPDEDEPTPTPTPTPTAPTPPVTVPVVPPPTDRPPIAPAPVAPPPEAKPPVASVPPETPAPRSEAAPVAAERAAPRADVSPVRRRPHPTAEVGLFGELGPPLGGETTLGGARVEGTWWLSPTIGLRASGGYRGSRAVDADTRLRVIDGGVGAALRAIDLGDWAFLLLRADLQLGQERASRARSDGAEQSRSGFSAALGVFVDLDVTLFGPVRAVLGVGSEIALGGSSLSVNHLPVATLPPVRLAGQLGLRWSF
jgi:hypothetical protein